MTTVNRYRVYVYFLQQWICILEDYDKDWVLNNLLDFLSKVMDHYDIELLNYVVVEVDAKGNEVDIKEGFTITKSEAIRMGLRDIND